MKANIEAVIITGAGRGIGKAIALQLAKRGAHVCCIAKTASAEVTKNEILELQGSASSIICDLTDYENSLRVIQAHIEKLPYRQMGLVLAAGVLGPMGPIHTASLSAWDETIRVNLLGNLAAYQAVASRMLANQFGRILFLAGGGAAYAYPTFPAYAASKTAIIRTVENLHHDLKDQGNFAVAALAPGAIETDMLQQVRAANAYIKTTTNIEIPVDCVQAFLFSDHCDFSGRFIHVNDNWHDYLNHHSTLTGDDLWKLRRIDL